MSVRIRQRDEEALAVAAKVVSEMDVTPEQRSIAMIGVMRGFAAGKAAGRLSLEPEVQALRAQLDEMHRNLSKARASAQAQVFNPAEVRYIKVINTYGVSVAQIAKLFGVEPPMIEAVLADRGVAGVRFQTPARKGFGRRALQP